MSTIARRVPLSILLAMLLLASSAREARAQYIGALFGYNFAGDTGCPTATNCEDKNWNYGFNFGAFGPILGFEAEFMVAKNFLGETAAHKSDVYAFMGNLLIGPRIGPVQPYGLIGLGVLGTNLEAPGVASQETNQFSYDVGGGLNIYFGEHFGVRGDFRYFHSFDGIDLGPFQVGLSEDEKLDFGRVSFGVMLRF